MSYISIMGSVMAVAFVLFAIAFPNYKRMKLQEAVKGKMYAIITRPGGRFADLFYADDLTIDIPIETANVGVHMKGKEKGINSVVLLPDAVEPIQYPVHSAEASRSFITKWFSPTVSIRSIMLVEGYGLPIIPSAIDPETGKHMIPLGTSGALIKAFKDQAHAKALTQLGGSYAAGTPASTGGVDAKKFNWALIGIVAALIAALASAGIGYYILTMVTNINQYY